MEDRVMTDTIPEAVIEAMARREEVLRRLRDQPRILGPTNAALSNELAHLEILIAASPEVR